MKNVIVVALDGARYAIELRWVREVTTLGHITPVPRSPDVIDGVFNFRGAVVPVVRVPHSTGSGQASLESARGARPGDAAVLVEVEGARVALRIDNVHSVSTLADAPDGLGLADPVGGGSVPLLDPPAIIRAAIAASQAIAKLGVA
jgi:purine-binding chemotaxis protein CheW